MNGMSLHPYPKGATIGCQISIVWCTVVGNHTQVIDWLHVDLNSSTGFSRTWICSQGRLLQAWILPLPTWRKSSVANAVRQVISPWIAGWKLVTKMFQRVLQLERVVALVLPRQHLRKVSGKGAGKSGGKKGKMFAMVDDSGTWWYSEGWWRSACCGRGECWTW